MADETPSKRVLVVDDDRDLADSLVELLEPLGYQMAVANDMDEARQRAVALDFDVALIDVRLGNASGTDLIADLRSACPDTLCVMMTAYAQTETAIEALKRGAYDYLRKPLDATTLRAALERCFERLRLMRERADVAQSLRSSEQRCRALFENHLDAILLSDATSGRVVDANAAAERLLGRTREQLLQAREIDLYPPECRQRHISSPEAGVSNESPTWSLETAICRPNGELRSVEITRTVVRYADQAIAQAIIRDVSKRRQAEDLARQHQSELAHALRVSALGEMASGLAHELNQPLAAICTYVDACKHMAASNNNRRVLAETLEKAAAQAQRAAATLQRVRGFVRKQEPRKTVTAINDVVRDVVALVEAERREAGARVVLNLTDEPAQVLADTIQIQQVLLNLIRNGFDAMKLSAGDRCDLTIGSRLLPQGIVEVAVSDCGLVLRDQNVERWFEPFFTTKPDGLGLGLSISRSIVQANGGRLWATPNPDRGTTFHVALNQDGRPLNSPLKNALTQPNL